jgi:hypothetical protein
MPKDDKTITSSYNNKYIKPKRVKFSKTYSKLKSKEFLLDDLNNFINYLLNKSDIERYY